MAGERSALKHHPSRRLARTITSPSAALMTALAKGIGPKPRSASVSATLWRFGSDRHLDNLQEASSLGGLARFRQIDLDKPSRYHDALEFSNGTIVLVTNLASGQRATVLQLLASPIEEKPQVSQPAA
jgi:hypothetical protein